MTPEVLRLSAFTARPEGGNPAGVVLDAAGLDEAQMLAIAADVGYSETAFARPRADGDLDVRYFSPAAEVPFCGHATIARGLRTSTTTSTGSARVTVHQGDDLGRPSLLLVDIPPGDAGIAVSGEAVALEAGT